MTNIYCIQLYYFSKFYKNIFLVLFITDKLINKYQAFRSF